MQWNKSGICNGFTTGDIGYYLDEKGLVASKELCEGDFFDIRDGKIWRTPKAANKKMTMERLLYNASCRNKTMLYGKPDLVRLYLHICEDGRKVIRYTRKPRELTVLIQQRDELYTVANAEKLIEMISAVDFEKYALMWQ